MADCQIFWLKVKKKIFVSRKVGTSTEKQLIFAKTFFFLFDSRSFGSKNIPSWQKIVEGIFQIFNSCKEKVIKTPLTTATVNSCQCIYDLPYLFIALSDASQVWIIIGRQLERFAFKAIYQIFLRNERMHFLSTTSHSVLAWRWSLKSSENFFGIK